MSIFSRYPDVAALAGGFQVRARVVDRADKCIAMRLPVDRIDQRCRSVLEALVLEDDDVAGIELLAEYGLGYWLAIFGHISGMVKIRFRAVSHPVDDVKYDEFLIVMMRRCHDIGKSPEQV